MACHHRVRFQFNETQVAIALHSNPGGQSTLNANGNAGQSAMIVDWENNESSQEPMDIDEAIEVDNRLLGELKDQE